MPVIRHDAGTGSGSARNPYRPKTAIIMRVLAMRESFLKRLMISSRATPRKPESKISKSINCLSCARGYSELPSAAMEIYSTDWTLRAKLIDEVFNREPFRHLRCTGNLFWGFGVELESFIAGRSNRMSDYERYRHMKRLERLLDAYLFEELFVYLRQYKEEFVAARGKARYDGLITELKGLMDHAHELISSRDPKRWDFILQDHGDVNDDPVLIAEREKLHAALTALDTL
jgi:hypothetical protein